MKKGFIRFFWFRNNCFKREEYYENKENIKEYFKEKSREKFIIIFIKLCKIINICDILILVVGILSYSEQKLINIIKIEIQKNKLEKDW